MNTLRIAFKDLKTFLRRRTTFIFSILMPIIMMIMTSYIFPQTDMQGQNAIGFYFEDSIAKTMFKNQIDELEEQNIFLFNTRDELLNSLIDGKITAGVVVPRDFSLKMATGNAELQIIPSPNNPQAGIMIAESLPGMFAQFNSSQNSIKVSSRLTNVDGSKFNYYDFMAPGIMAMISIMSVMTGLAASITRERELGTMDGLMVTPISRGSIVVGKIIAQTVRGMMQALIVLVISILIFHVHIVGSIWLTIFILILGTFSFIGIGIIVTASFKEQEAAEITMTTITFPMIFFSGVFFPIEQMPNFAKVVSKIFPLTYSADALRKVVVLGASIGDVRNQIFVLLAFALTTSIVASLSFQKLVQE
ncbi:MAG: ABC transporter permease [Thermotogota bacterium]|nr:ABC transporter permease [Thermotogota bacterium]